jgi:hypothetical protein
MITLPKMIGATGNDCLVSAVAMVSMYWRQIRPNLGWNLPLNFDGKKWADFYEKGLSYVRTSGMPYNNIKRFLKRLNLPLRARLEFLEDMYELRNLIFRNIPPIVLYDHTFFLKNVRGPSHSIILVDQTAELFVSVNPSLEPKFFYKIAKTDFKEAWKLNQNATVIIHPKNYRIEETKIPTKNLMHFFQKKQGIV